MIVPALLTPEKQADLSAIEAAARDVSRGLAKGTLVVFETTLPVGTTRNRLGPILEEGSGLHMGVDFQLLQSGARVVRAGAPRPGHLSEGGGWHRCAQR